MEFESKVVSFYIASKMHELGIPQTTDLWWVQTFRDGFFAEGKSHKDATKEDLIQFLVDSTDYRATPSLGYAAYLPCELIDFLPYETYIRKNYTTLTVDPDSPQVDLYEVESLIEKHKATGDTLANALGTMLIVLVEGDYLDVNTL